MIIENSLEKWVTKFRRKIFWEKADDREIKQLSKFLKLNGYRKFLGKSDQKAIVITKKSNAY